MQHIVLQLPGYIFLYLKYYIAIFTINYLKQQNVLIKKGKSKGEGHHVDQCLG